MAYTKDLEERNLFLSEHLQSTNDKIATLEAEIARLKANEVIGQSSATSNTTPGKQIRTREKFVWKERMIISRKICPTLSTIFCLTLILLPTDGRSQLVDSQKSSWPA